MISSQISIYDLAEDRFCPDGDINQIVKKLDSLCLSNEVITKITKEWKKWEHVPNHGYRLSYFLNLNGELQGDFFDELNKIVEFAKERKIELSPCGLYYFSKGHGLMSIYSLFLDGRKKIKHMREVGAK